VGGEEPPPAEPSPKPPPEEPPPAPADAGAPARALALHDEAKELYANGDYHAALDKLREAVRLDPDAKVLFYNLGVIEERLRDLPAAISDYRRCLELERDPVERQHLEQVIARLEGASTRLQVAVAPSDARPPEGDGSPGEPRHTEEKPGISPWVWATGGAAVGAFVVAASLAARAATIDPGDGARTGPGTEVEDLREDAAAAHRFAIAADVFLALGVAASVGTVAILIWGGDEEPQVALRPAPLGGALRVSF
ncbi:MAG: tetratricopeptide repeat protein, partial [Myxococcales bacterium]|nr:tetratricopeptide repeat protein [Myxococcales bacterium]